MSDNHNPWKTLDTKEIYDNPWIKVREDKIINPGGGNGIYGVVSFKNKAIGIVPVDADGFTYLVGQYRYTINEYSWEIPEGGGAMGVDPLESAKRELREETGLRAKKWTNLGRLHTSNSVTDEEGFIFLAQDLVEGESEPEETEDLKVKRVHLREAIEMVMNAEITDSLAIVGILKAAKYLGY